MDPYTKTGENDSEKNTRNTDGLKNGGTEEPSIHFRPGADEIANEIPDSFQILERDDRRSPNNRQPKNDDIYPWQQTIAGRPVYVQEPPPQAGRMDSHRPGNLYRQDRRDRDDSDYWYRQDRREQDDRDNWYRQDRRERDERENSVPLNLSEERIFHFNTTQIRNRFIRKVYTLLSIQLLITFGFIFIAIHTDSIRLFLLKNTLILFIVSIMTFVMIITLTCCSWAQKKFPINLICFFIVTALYTYILAAISCIYDTQAVYLATGTCAGVCFLVSILACQMKWDITKCGCILYILLIGLLIYSFFCMILMHTVKSQTFEVMMTVYGGIGLTIFILFLMFDTQLIMGGRTIELSPEEYILGALKLYMDIILIFYYLLILFRQ